MLCLVCNQRYAIARYTIDNRDTIADRDTVADAGAPADSDSWLWSYIAVSGEERMLVPILHSKFFSNYGENEEDQVPDRPP